MEKAEFDLQFIRRSYLRLRMTLACSEKTGALS